MWYKFFAHNQQAVYGYGSEAKAAQYVARLNQGRDVNVYGYEALADNDAEASRMAGLADIAAEGVDLAEELADAAAD